MALKQDLLALNRLHAGEINTQLPYTFEDVRHILISSVKFNKLHSFDGTLPPDTVSKLRAEGIDVRLDDKGNTILKWGYQ